MPALIARLKGNLTQHPTVREFAVLPNGQCFRPAELFVFLETEIPNLRRDAESLANAGHVHASRPDSNYPCYWMTEPFVEFVRA
jgi:hypothetical protein